MTSWDITHAISKGMAGHAPVESIMTREVISALPGQRILKIVRALQQYDISAMPVVDQDGRILGKIGSDLLAARLLLPILQSQEPA